MLKTTNPKIKAINDKKELKIIYPIFFFSKQRHALLAEIERRYIPHNVECSIIS